MQTKSIFITGIGTGVGKSVVSAIVTEALQADYWKPIQAGLDDGTDAATIQQLISNTATQIHKEAYVLKMPASPHIAAAAENKILEINNIQNAMPKTNNPYLIIEGAGGLMVPINHHQFMADVIKALKAPVILVSRNYLGSINHSLLTALVCKQYNLPVVGWVFNDHYLQYEQEIVNWSGFPYIGSITFTEKPNRQFVLEQATKIKERLIELL
ncbi:MAG: dethiobiotin synthase [Sphingobacteriales bacterium]|uniref:dethiobiotin synthase n=1 Tax=Hydrotalea flava TaxID=714549 RepID=UPI00082E58D8|nr:dethiobiotin synthase [Hydrotalea flava]RTL51982.1 MAG: dethiobiotin synthase [Sphingobacteriales bacterium]